MTVAGGGNKFAVVKHSAGDSSPWGAAVIHHSKRHWFTLPREQSSM